MSIPVYQTFLVGFRDGSPYRGEVRGPYGQSDVFGIKETADALMYDHDAVIRVNLRGTQDWAADRNKAIQAAEKLWNKS